MKTKTSQFEFNSNDLKIIGNYLNSVKLVTINDSLLNSPLSQNSIKLLKATKDNNELYQKLTELDKKTMQYQSIDDAIQFLYIYRINCLREFLDVTTFEMIGFFLWVNDSKFIDKSIMRALRFKLSKTSGKWYYKPIKYLGGKGGGYNKAKEFNPSKLIELETND